MNQKGNKWDQKQTFYKAVILALQQMFLSEGRYLWNDFRSQPGDATV